MVSATKIYAISEKRFYTSVDGGNTWTGRNLSGNYMSDFHFFDENNGVAVDQGGAFFNTTDGGVT
jgi:photosystem II stability/assembly factor-like uncharacterized protein